MQKVSVRKILLPLFLLLMAMTATLGAASIAVTNPGDLTLTALISPGPTFTAFDIRGTALLAVSNSGPLGSVFVTDGVPLGLPAPASPNSLMLATDVTTAERGLLTFS